MRGAATCNAKISVERVTLKATDPFRDIAQHEARVEHLVIEREVANRNLIEAGLVLPVALTQLRAQAFQFVARRLAFPVMLLGELQLTLCADAGETQIVCRNHGDELLRK